MKRSIWLLALATIFAAGVAVAAEAAGEAVETKTRAVTIFKDGYGYFIREGSGQLADGWCIIDFLPQAAQGSLWIYSREPGDTIDTVVSMQRNLVDFETTDELRHALSTKIGLPFNFRHNDTTVSGKLLEVGQETLTLKRDTEVVLLKLADIDEAEVVGYPLKIKINSEDDRTQLGFGYLRQGISWVPSYVLNVLDDKSAELTLRGTVLNNVEDLKKCEVYLVVGIPNFAHKGLLDHIARIAGVAAGREGFAYDMAQQLANVPGAPMMGAGYGGGGFGAAPALVSLAGQELTELFIYKKQELSLRAGDVGMVTVFSGPVGYKSMYEWNANGPTVWHVLQIENSLGMPLTTGSILTVREGQPIGEDTLRYTPAGGTGNVRLSPAGGVLTAQAEVEAGRGNPIKFNEREYIPATMEGTLKLTNYRSESVTVNITRSVAGHVKEMSDEGNVARTAPYADNLTVLSTMEWTVQVAPGATKEVKYRYETYVGLQLPPVVDSPGPGGYGGMAEPMGK